MPSTRDQQRAHRKALTAVRFKQGLCVECGERPAEQSIKKRSVTQQSNRKCTACREKRAAYHAKWEAKRRARRNEEKRCHRCGGLRDVPGRKECFQCRDRIKAVYWTHHREHRLAEHKVAHQALKLVVMEHYGGAKCACCGETHMEFLAMDHIGPRGTGNQHRLAAFGSKQGGNIISWLKQHNFPPGFRVLCHNCNLSHGHVGYCPHDREREALIGGP